MTILLNGETTALREGTRLADAIAALTAASTGVAVAVDGEVVPRSQWPSTRLVDGAVVEVVTAVQGG